MTTVTFREESPPLDIAENLTLTDFDSPDITSSPLTITLTGAVDEDWEGLMVEVGGTGVRVSPVQAVQQYTQQYVLNGSTSFSEYQQVGVGCRCGRSGVWEGLGVGGVGCGCRQSLFAHVQKTNSSLPFLGPTRGAHNGSKLHSL